MPTKTTVKSFFLLLLLITGSFGALYAQTLAEQTPPAHLQPILRAPGSSILGSVYLYRGRKLNSPFSVEIPIQELNDPIASRHFRRFRTWNTVGRLTGLASVAYVLFNRTPDRQTSRAVYIGSLVASIGFSLLSNDQVSKAVNRYNAVVGTPRVGLALTSTSFSGPVAGLGLSIPIVHQSN